MCLCIFKYKNAPNRKEFNYKPYLLGILISVLAATVITLFIQLTPFISKALNLSEEMTIDIFLAIHGLYFITFDFLTYFLMEFIQKYTRYTPKLPWFTIFIIVILSLDVLDLLLNFPLQHIFIISVTDINRVNKFIQTPGMPINLLYFHFFATYIPVTIAFIVLIIKIVKVPAFYKNQFICILLSIIVSVIGDAFYIISPVIKTNFNVIFFDISSILVYYYTIHFSPKKLIANFQTELISNINDAIIAFDIHGECIFFNKKYDLLISEFKDYNLTSIEPFSNWDLETKTLKPEFISKIREYKSVLSTNYFTNSKEKSNLIDLTFTNIKISNGTDTQYFRGHFKTLDNTNISQKNKSNTIYGYFYSLHNFTDEQKEIDKQNYISTHDELTGIYNRTKFEIEVSKHLCADHESKYLMICSDIEKFKLINELFGKAAADLLLVRIAKHIKSLVRTGTIYGRIQGDRFAILIKKDHFKEYQFITESTLCAYMEDNPNYPVTIYMGVYEIEDVQMPVAVMCDRAFLAIDKIKGNTEKRIAYYTDDIRNSIIKAQKLVSQFRKALRNEEFQIYIQPQTDKNGICKGGEALARWVHPVDGIFYPIEFIPLLENNGIITKLDVYIWNLAAKTLKIWKERGLSDFYISVNISTKDLAFIDIYETFTNLVKKYDISPANLRLEITETAILMNLEEQIKLITKLREAGFYIEMDDFGSGYSSLNMLKDINFDILKIDMKFLEKTDNPERSMTILKSIIEMAKALNIGVITEGVETEEQLNYLSKIGCNNFQGFYFDKPLPLKDFETKYLK